MKRYLWILPVVLVAACTLPVGQKRALFSLPADQIADILRSNADFAFETVVPVDIALTVDLYDASRGRSAANAGQEAAVFVNISDQDGNTLLTSMMESSGGLETRFFVPVGSQRLTLLLRAAGYESRSVDIGDPARLSRIDRSMAMASTDSPVAPDELVDRDMDGVPNLYDAAPDDPLIAFILRMSGGGPKGSEAGGITLAFEDSYPGLGDGDYNDLLAQMCITEYYAGPKGGCALSKIDIDAYAIAKVAGYNHSFGLVVHYPGVSATVNTARYDAEGNALSSETLSAASDLANVVLFPSTEQAAAPNRGAELFHGYRSRVTLTAFVTEAGAPSEGFAGLNRLGVEAPPYDPYLLVHQNGRDIHMIGRTALNGNPDPHSFIDGNGYPWVLVVPADWGHPAEGATIGGVYYDFDEWVSSRGAEHADWYDRENGNVDASRIVVPAYPLP